MLRGRTIWLLCLALGAALELGVSYAGHRREAWDSGLYWSVGLPVAAVASAAVGYFTSGNSWLAPGLIVPGQLLTMISHSGSDLGLWPLTLVLGAVLSLPFVGVAFAARQFRRRN